MPVIVDTGLLLAKILFRTYRHFLRNTFRHITTSLMRREKDRASREALLARLTNRILLEDLQDRDFAGNIADKLVASVNQPVALAPGPLQVSVSIGMAY